LKKATIFIIAFMVSFLTIYSVYYYKEIKKLDQSVVALAKDLPNTQFGFEGNADNDKNMIYSPGLEQVLSASTKNDSLPSTIPDEHFAAFNTTYTRDHMEKFYENLVSKFPNHPPVEFKDVKDGERVLMSYFFYNVHLPKGFRVSASAVDFHGVRVKALQYHPAETDTGKVSFYKNDATHEYAFKIKINGGTEELIIYNTPADSPWKSVMTQSGEMISNPKYLYHPAKDESVLMPELDFNITKDHDPKEAAYSDYALVEERYKFKISAPVEAGPLEVSASYNTPKNYIMNGHLIFYITAVPKQQKPFCIISLKNPEILKKEKKR
jgi:hypothetical protein